MLKKITIIQNERIKNNLKAHDEKIIELYDLSAIDKISLSRDFLNLIGNLNNKFNSIKWFANSVSSKNQYISGFYRNIYRLFQLIETIKHTQKEELIFFLTDKYLIKQFTAFCSTKNISVILHASKLTTFLGVLVSIIKAVVFIARFVYFSLKKNHLIKSNLDMLIKKNIKFQESHYILRTWIDQRTFNVQGKYEKDPYFGNLPQFLQKWQNLIITGSILETKKLQQIIDNIKNNYEQGWRFIPQEYFLYDHNYIDAIILLIKTIKTLFLKATFNGIDVTYLLRGEIFENICSGEIITNYLYYFFAKNLSTRINCDFFAFPYENHSWEKLTILGFKESSPKTFLLGYQFASITNKEFNYFLAKNEANIAPLPDKILTVGSEASKILIQNGFYPQNIIRDGCAIRYQYLFGRKIKPRNSNNVILFAFSIGLEETILALKFLLKAFNQNTSYKLLLKFHPLTPFDLIISKSKQKIPNYVEVISNKSMEEMLNVIDIFVYTETSACMEALMCGIPVIHVDIDDFYESDQLFNCNYLKWTAKSPQELLKTIDEIYNMDNGEFLQQQIAARKYIERYYNDVTQEKLAEFIRKD